MVFEICKIIIRLLKLISLGKNRVSVRAKGDGRPHLSHSGSDPRYVPDDKLGTNRCGGGSTIYCT